MSKLDWLRCESLFIFMSVCLPSKDLESCHPLNRFIKLIKHKIQMSKLSLSCDWDMRVYRSVCLSSAALKSCPPHLISELPTWCQLQIEKDKSEVYSHLLREDCVQKFIFQILTFQEFSGWDGIQLGPSGEKLARYERIILPTKCKLSLEGRGRKLNSGLSSSSRYNPAISVARAHFILQLEVVACFGFSRFSRLWDGGEGTTLHLMTCCWHVGWLVGLGGRKGTLWNVEWHQIECGALWNVIK